jgi:hypothetical protein
MSAEPVEVADLAHGPESEVHADWVLALDRLEVDVLLAERLVRSLDPAPLQEWRPPLLTGPMPDDLVDRATAILRRQEAVLAALTSALDLNGRHQGLTRRIAAVLTPGPRPAYVDATA